METRVDDPVGPKKDEASEANRPICLENRRFILFSIRLGSKDRYKGNQMNSFIATLNCHIALGDQETPT